MWCSMLQLPGRFLAVAGLQCEVQLAGQILFEILEKKLGDVYNLNR